MFIQKPESGSGCKLKAQENHCCTFSLDGRSCCQKQVRTERRSVKTGTMTSLMNCVWIYGRVESSTGLIIHRRVAVLLTRTRLESWRSVSWHTVRACVCDSFVQGEAGAHWRRKPRLLLTAQRRTRQEIPHAVVRWVRGRAHCPHQTVFLLHRPKVYTLCLPFLTPHPDASSNSMYLKSGSGVVVSGSGDIMGGLCYVCKK